MSKNTKQCSTFDDNAGQIEGNPSNRLIVAQLASPKSRAAVKIDNPFQRFCPPLECRLGKQRGALETLASPAEDLAAPTPSLSRREKSVSNALFLFSGAAQVFGSFLIPPPDYRIS